jgi:hypothetical protein
VTTTVIASYGQQHPEIYKDFAKNIVLMLDTDVVGVNSMMYTCFGADCRNVCHCCGLLEDELDESYSSDVQSFTKQQQKDCNALLSAIVSVTQGCSRG